jgi:hypothetical protein
MNKNQASMENDDARILKDLEEQIKQTKDIAKRKKMVQLYRQFTFFIQNNDECSVKEKDEYFKYVKQVEDFTRRSDKLLEGGCQFSADEIQRVKAVFNVDISKLQNLTIPGYWRDVMKNANVRWGPLDEELLETLLRVDVHTKLNPENRTTEFVEFKFVFDPIGKQLRAFSDDNLWVRIIFKNDELSLIENSKINWKDSKNPLNENGKAGGVQTKQSILDLFTTKDFSLEDDVEEEEHSTSDEPIGQIDREEMEKMIDELVNVVSFSLEYYLGVQPVEEDEDDFDETEY